MAENKLAKIEKIELIEFAKPDETRYARALKKGDPNDNNYVALSGSIISLFGGLAFGIGCFPPPNGSILMAFITWLSTAIGGSLLSCLVLNRLYYQRTCRKTLADPLCRFEWRLAKAVEIFNERVYAFNHLLSGHELCLAPGDEKELARIHGLLSQSRKVLARGKETRD